ncbi:type II secretion system protein [Neptuniibacter marinus]|uniref:type II secretion system protein n=1 Tax=Neptuniibacter marinus TaxID=1806670 RepID=UPI00082B8F52|nr:prepilin-type N-terminal cleavage/methylation domain-containing protein [Neptuniibacter marinus]
MANRIASLRSFQKGFSLLELVVSILVVAVLMAVAYIKLERLAEDVERVSFEGVRNNIQAQVTLKVAYWFAEQQYVSGQELEKSNPISLISYKPTNYVGELDYNELLVAQSERWYFVSDKHWLVYKVKRSEHLKNDFQQKDLLPFQLTVKFQHGRHEQGLATEVILRPLYSFTWQVDSDG